MKLINHVPLLFSLLIGISLISLEFIPSIHTVGEPITKVTYTLEKAETPAIGWWETWRVEGSPNWTFINHSDVSTFLMTVHCSYEEGGGYIDRLDKLRQDAESWGLYVPDSVTSQFNSTYHFWVVRDMGYDPNFSDRHLYSISLYLTYRLVENGTIISPPKTIASTLGSDLRSDPIGVFQYMLPFMLIVGSFLCWVAVNFPRGKSGCQG
jgi:hypothetical protein